MKNFILKYSSYSDKIYSGNDLEIKLAYFSGVKFDLKNDICFLCFDTITIDNRPINLRFRLDFETQNESDVYYSLYQDLFPIGISAASNIPMLLAVSCFYKQHSDVDEWYLLYAIQSNSEEQLVFKIIMNRNIFFQFMFIFDHIRKCGLVSEDNIFLLNKFNYFKSNTETIKLNQYEPSITMDHKLYCNKPKRFSKSFTCYCIITFVKGDRSFAISIPVKSKNIFREYRKKFTLNILDYDYQIHNANIPTYYITEGFPIEFSLSADNPMSKFIFVGLSTSCNPEYKYFIIPKELFSRIGKICYSYIIK